MEQLQALQRLTEVVDCLGFPLTIRMLAGIAKGDCKYRGDGSEDHARACDDIAETLTVAANMIAGESAR